MRYLLIGAWLLAAGSCAQAQAPLKPADPEMQSRCRTAVDQAIPQLRATPTRTARDKVDKEKLESRIAARIAENRSKGVDECVTWGQVMKIAFTS